MDKRSDTSHDDSTFPRRYRHGRRLGRHGCLPARRLTNLRGAHGDRTLLHDRLPRRRWCGASTSSGLDAAAARHRHPAFRRRALRPPGQRQGRHHQSAHRQSPRRKSRLTPDDATAGGPARSASISIPSADLLRIVSSGGVDAVEPRAPTSTPAWCVVSTAPAYPRPARSCRPNPLRRRHAFGDRGWPTPTVRGTLLRQGTLLFDIDDATDALYLQQPPAAWRRWSMSSGVSSASVRARSGSTSRPIGAGPQSRLADQRQPALSTRSARAARQARARGSRV